MRLLIIVIGFLACIGCRTDSVFVKNKPIYLQVIERVEKGDIKPDASGAAQLPADLRDASVDGEVYVLYPSPAQLLIVFKTWRGKGYNMQGFLYARTPLESEIERDYYGNSVVIIGPLELTLEDKLEPSWYRVSHRLD
jgi:hypothetical protein